MKKILKLLDLWEVRPKTPPCVNNGPSTEFFIIYDESSSPGPDYPASLLKLCRTGYIIDVDYPIEAHL